VNFYHKNTFTTVLIIQVNFISDYQSSKSEGARKWFSRLRIRLRPRSAS